MFLNARPTDLASNLPDQHRVERGEIRGEAPQVFPFTKQAADYAGQYADIQALGRELARKGTLHLVSKALASNQE